MHASMYVHFPPVISESPKVNCSTTVTVNSSGCCTGGSDLCHAIGGGCYCDQNCYVRDDCCKDIIDIGCDCKF